MPRMSLGEFELIGRYFARPVRRAALGIGDDCALLALGQGQQLATSTDMLVEGRHFLPTVPPERLGHKALAVNLSDLAACGARPLAFTLALSMPRVDEAFLEGFSRGLLALAAAHDAELIGGDTTAGPLAICITVFGEVPPGRALLRSGAQEGDDVYVSGLVGEARLGLEAFRGNERLEAADFEQARRAMECPEPRVALGMALRGVASSAIDISDGLLGDLGHILRASGVGAAVEAAAVPRSPALARLPLARQHEYTLAGGDDYELLFTAPRSHAEAVARAANEAGTPVTRIGRIERDPGVRLLDETGARLEGAFAGFDHFRA
jgi:thiamine-monophosphate kinase